MDRFQAMTIFATVADRGSFAAAARALGLSPAAVTRAVAALEGRVGARLLARTTRSVRLTEVGARFLEDCRRILAEVEDAEAAAAGDHGTPRGELAVTAPTQFGRLHLGPCLPAFLVAHPEVTIRLLLVDRVVSLVEEGLDVALRIGPLTQGSLVAVRLGEVRRVVVAAPGYLATQGVPAHPSELERHRLIAAASVMSGDSWTFRADDKALAVRIQARLWTSTPDVAIAAAASGFGLTRVPDYQVAAELRRGELVPVLTAFEPAPLPVSLVTAEGRRAAAKVRAFVDFMAPRLRRAIRPEAQPAQNA